MQYTGSCHCGRIAYEVDGELKQAIECNCTHCRRKGYLLWFVPREQLRLTAGEDALATYRFNKRVLDHHFCPTCGCAPFAFGTGPGGARTAAINVRCLEGVDLATLPRQAYDGLHKS